MRAAGRFIGSRTNNRSHEAVAPAGHGADVPATKLAIMQCPPQCRDVRLEIVLLDDDAGPDPRDQLPLAHELARALNQRDQDIEGAAAETERLILFEEEALARAQSEGTKRDRRCGWIAGRTLHSHVTWFGILRLAIGSARCHSLMQDCRRAAILQTIAPR